MTVGFGSSLKAKIDGKHKPPGSLGRLERIAAQVATLQGRLDPLMHRGTLIVFVGDHGIAESGVSTFAISNTRRMALTMAEGGAAANVFAREAGLDLRIVNAGARGGAFDHPRIEEHAIGEGTQNFLRHPAMTEEELDRALAAGEALGSGTVGDALALGDVGTGNSSAATMIVHRLTGARLRDIVGRGAGLSDEGVVHKHAILTRASERVSRPLSPRDVLREFGGFEIAMMVGAMIAAARARRLILVDGFAASAAAMLAANLSPETRAAMLFCHLSPEPGQRVMLDAMGALPLLTLDMRLGEGTGAALAWPVVRAAVAMLNDMAGDGDTPDAATG